MNALNPSLFGVTVQVRASLQPLRVKDENYHRWSFMTGRSGKTTKARKVRPRKRGKGRKRRGERR